MRLAHSLRVAPVHVPLSLCQLIQTTPHLGGLKKQVSSSPSCVSGSAGQVLGWFHPDPGLWLRLAGGQLGGKVHGGLRRGQAVVPAAGPLARGLCPPVGVLGIFTAPSSLSFQEGGGRTPSGPLRPRPRKSQGPTSATSY